MFDYKEKGFKFFKVDSTNRNLLETINKNDSNEQMTLKFTNVEKTFKDDRTIEDIKYELLLLNGLDLNTKLIQQNIDDNEFYIDDSSSFIFAITNKPYKNIDETIIKVFKQKNCEGSLDVYLDDNNFINSQDKTNTIKQIESFSNNIKVWVL